METVQHFCSVCGSDVQVPVDLLAGLAAAPALITKAIRTAAPAPIERWSPADGWSPAEIAAHLADAEIITAWRLGQTLAEDEPDIQPYDQDRWALAMRYSGRDLATSLGAFAAVRAANVELLRRLDDAGWERTYRHHEYGRTSIRTLAYHKADHDLAHLAQLEGI